MSRILTLLLLAGPLVGPEAAASTLFRCVGEQGETVFALIRHG